MSFWLYFLLFYLSNFNEASSTVLFNIQIKPFRLDLQTLWSKFLFRLITRLACWYIDKKFNQNISILNNQSFLTRIEVTTTHVITLVVLWGVTKKKVVKYHNLFIKAFEFLEKKCF